MHEERPNLGRINTGIEQPIFFNIFDPLAEPLCAGRRFANGTRIATIKGFASTPATTTDNLVCAFGNEISTILN